MTDEELGEAVERIMSNALDDPMPDDLKTDVANHIEPYTVNAYLKHAEVMTCIELAYPLIRDHVINNRLPSREA